jgi:regulator of sigma D
VSVGLARQYLRRAGRGGTIETHTRLNNMTESATEHPDRRQRTRDVIDKLVTERTEMLVLFCRAAGIDSITPGANISTLQTSADVVEEFCQVLVDYVAAGHFALYERISNGRERRRAILDVAERIYPDLAATTDAAVEFNEKYQNRLAAEDREALAADLSGLGEQLALRVELEDQLLAQMR